MEVVKRRGFLDLWLPLHNLQFITFTSCALEENRPTSNSPAQINSDPVLVALLDSHYTKLFELVEKALCYRLLKELCPSTILPSLCREMRPWNGIWTRSLSHFCSSHEI
ncbi:Fasciclin-like arabinogalactan protein 17 [Forsythia ovata]|uniref:Fasciclin-like arabinogalactan protein 17 n=1 Tax=Forsythia ovata TaxID=205694 RepID=A0ABD1TUC1_9LAMI